MVAVALDRREARGVTELRGLVGVELEVGLADLGGVVPVVEGVPPSPGLAGRLEADAARWRLAVALAPLDADRWVIQASLCDVAEVCRAHTATITDDPTPAVAALLGTVSAAIGRAPADRERWSVPPSADRYARFVAGRASSIWYRLSPPVPLEHLHDRRLDPIERGVFIDPRMSVAQWILGRRRFEARDFAGARNAFSRASLAAPDRLIYLADEAAALEALGQHEAARGAWEAIRAKAPRDARFALPRARVLAAMERTREAAAELDALGPRFQGDARVLALRVAIAERAGARAEDQALLERWQSADATAPEPVRRRIALLVRRGALAEADALVPELARRGATEEATRLGLSLSASLGRLDQARADAERLGEPAVAAALALRAGLERGDDPATLEVLAQDPLGRVAVAERYLVRGDAARALRAVDAVLAVDAWMPEALVLRARALEALGRADDAAEARARAHDVDPMRVSSSTAALR